MSDPKFQRHGTGPAAGSANPAAPPATPARHQSDAAPQRGAPAMPPSTPASPAAADPNAPRPGSSGRVRHDERGNAIWDWVTTTTKNAILSATSLLKKLDSTELSLEETPAEKEKSALLPRKRPGGGFNPYEQANNKPSGKK
jgi:hypothetical protein